MRLCLNSAAPTKKKVEEKNFVFSLRFFEGGQPPRKFCQAKDAKKSFFILPPALDKGPTLCYIVITMREKNKAPRKSEVQESTQNIEDDFRDMMPTSEEFHAVEYVEPSEEFYAVRYTEPGEPVNN
jgi:hypothetical protein